ncbi:hypothetical protein [Phosphitispora fastidiosa]|uniref:hypothetical protein n=1 Tax=Phosphitispora fastidiosa TaxID=2837202 RepID=UPI001E578335|nr:hypothetical protein [Phosphitispora fastidiosa]MBU7005693.1 hypothetical protein [Phosphitispora fastidiosa]
MVTHKKAQKDTAAQRKDAAGVKQDRTVETEEKLDYKLQVPPEFVPTELGSAVFASVEGSPADEEFLIADKDSNDDIEDGVKNSRE